MKASAQVSVIIPTFNRAMNVRRAIESVLTQTYPAREILVMDDGSTDNTAAVVAALGSDRIRYLWACNSGGPACPRNRGLAVAGGEYVAFLDSDDWWCPNKLELSVRCLESGADVVYHDLYWITRVGQRFVWRRVHTRKLRRPVFHDLLSGGNALSNSSVVVRRSVLLAVDGFDEDPALVAAEDYEAWMRVAKRTEQFVRIPHTLGFYWAGGGNISSPTRVLRYVEEIRRRHLQPTASGADARDRCWCDFAEGRAQYLLGEYARAQQTLRRVPLRLAPLAICGKSCWMRVALRWRDLRASKPRDAPARR